MGTFKSAALGLVVFGLFTGALNAFADSADSPASIDKALADFQVQYPDLANLFSAEDFRVKGEQSVIEDKIKANDTTVVLAIASAKKKLDAMQVSTRAANSLEAVLVGPNQFPRIYNLAKKAAATLGLSDNFHVFIKGSSEINAYTYSYNPNDYDVVIYSALVDLLDDEALLATLGHEMGHVKDQALLYGALLSASFELANVSTPSASHKPFYDSMFHELPASLRSEMADAAVTLVAEKNVIAMGGAFDASEFSRNDELTADRAGVIVGGGPKGMLKILAQLIFESKALGVDVNLEQLVSQIRVVLSGDPDDFSKLLSAQPDHPYTPLRLVEANDFGMSKEFKEIQARLNEPNFEKELDIFSRIYGADYTISMAYKDYLDKKADTDETLVRLKAKDSFVKQIEHLGKGLSAIGMQIMGQLAASPLTQPGDALFDRFVSKARTDATNGLKKVLAKPLMDELNRRAGAAAEPADQATELRAKAKTLQDLLEIQ